MRAVPVRKLPSRVTVVGLDRAPHRAFLRALGISDADFEKPFVGVVSTDGRVTPCNALLGDLARQACVAVRESGGVPFDFASISVADSMSMNHGGMRFSLVSRGMPMKTRGTGMAAAFSSRPARKISLSSR